MNYAYKVELEIRIATRHEYLKKALIALKANDVGKLNICSIYAEREQKNIDSLEEIREHYEKNNVNCSNSI